MPALTAVLAGLLLIEWARRRAKLLDNLTAGFRFGHRTAIYVPAQAAVFASLFALSTVLFDESPAVASLALRQTGLLVAAWLVAAAATFIVWLHVLVPLRRVPALAREHAAQLAGACVLGGAAYGVGRLAQSLWLPLRQITFAAAGFVLRAVVHEPIIEATGFTLGTDRFLVEIAPACSGYEGIGLTCVFVAAALWLFRERLRFPQAYVLFGLAVVVPWAANIVRLVTLVVVGTYVSPEMAAGAFHSYAGAILFGAIALGLVAFALRSPALSNTGARNGAPNPVAPYLMPLLAMVVTGLVSRAFSHGTNQPLWPLRPLAGLAALAAYLPTYRRLVRTPAVTLRIDPGAPAHAGSDPRVSWIAPIVGLLLAGVWVAAELVRGRGIAAVAASDSMAALATRIVTAIVIAPIAEELAFRGFLARRLSTRAFDELAPWRISIAAVVVSSVAFGLLHQRPVVGTLAGASYALLFRRCGRLADSVVAHAVTNAALVVVASLTGAWDLWL
jgi:exosortase E/protease (VPEID-CTERM system)